MILFLESNNNAILLEKVIKKIEEINPSVSICFLSYSNAKNKFNINRGLKSYYLKEVECECGRDEFYLLISNIEKEFPEFTLNQCIFLDRILRNFSYEKAFDILLDYGLRFRELILREKIEFIFGEISLGCELLFYYISKYYGKCYRDPLNTYALNELRLILFDNFHSNKTLVDDTSNSITEDTLKAEIDKRINININDKLGSKIKKKSFKKTINKINYLVKNYDSYDYRYDFSLKMNNFLRYVIYQVNKIVFSYENILLEKEEFFYFPLHIQPEATPDLVAPYYNDQVYLIKQIAKALPINMILVVKEHPNKASGINFISKLSLEKIRNVRFVSPDTESNKLIKFSKGVITIAGTAGIEARYFRKPVLLFSEVYYGNYLKNVTKCFNFSNLPETLKGMKISAEDEGYCKNNQDILLFFNLLKENTFPCYIYDPFIDDKVLESQNVDNLAISINKFVTSFYAN